MFKYCDCPVCKGKTEHCELCKTGGMPIATCDHCGKLVPGEAPTCNHCAKTVVERTLHQGPEPYRKGHTLHPKLHNIRMNLWLTGKSDRDIADICNTARETISNWRNQFDLPPHFVPRRQERESIMDKQKERIKAFHKKGLTDVEIATIMEFHESYVRRLRREQGLKPNKPAYPCLCEKCDRPFTSPRTTAKVCPSCKSSKRTGTATLIKLRMEFRELVTTNPERAKEIYLEIQAIEGDDFVKEVLGEIEEDSDV